MNYLIQKKYFYLTQHNNSVKSLFSILIFNNPKCFQNNLIIFCKTNSLTKRHVGIFFTGSY